MTWFSTWPSPSGPDYKPHDTEAQALAHADEIVKSKRATVATVFQTDQLEESE